MNWRSAEHVIAERARDGVTVDRLEAEAWKQRIWCAALWECLVAERWSVAWGSWRRMLALVRNQDGRRWRRATERRDRAVRRTERARAALKGAGR